MKIFQKRRIRRLIRQLHPVLPCHDLLRVGPDGDGGYLLPNDFDEIDACFSPGVDTEAGFDESIAARGIPVFLADGSVSGPPLENELFQFEPFFLGGHTQGDHIRLDDWVIEAGFDADSELILQMDIEGAEYEVLGSLDGDFLRRFRFIVVEFHNLSGLWDRDFFRSAKNAFDVLLANHAPVHLHVNNCCGVDYRHGLAIPNIMEFSFARRDRITAQYSDRYPHDLDFPNIAGADIQLPSDWYRS